MLSLECKDCYFDQLCEFLDLRIFSAGIAGRKLRAKRNETLLCVLVPSVTRCRSLTCWEFCSLTLAGLFEIVSTSFDGFETVEKSNY